MDYNDNVKKVHPSGRARPMSDFNLLIDGKMVPGDQTMAVLVAP
jgi:hypothetical protein